MDSVNLVPFQWPAEWHSAQQLKLLANTPVNCLFCDNDAVSAAARHAGLTVIDPKSASPSPLAEVKWDAPPAPRVIGGLVWPSVRMSPGARRDTAQAGPTGAPWIDSNAWVAHLARVRAKGAPLWLSFGAAQKKSTIDTSAYLTALVDSAAAGARWIVSLDPAISKGLTQGNADATQTWAAITRMLRFFEDNRRWAAWEPWGALGVLSTYKGDHEYFGQEVLNLSARRNLHYRVLDRTAPPPERPLDHLRAILYVDPEVPTPAWKAALASFAQKGGQLILPKQLAAEFPAEATLPCPVAGYQSRTCGRGRISAATRDWDDPYFLAQDAHSLVSRMHDPVRIFNARSLWEHYSESADSRSAVLQLVGFSRGSYDSVSIRAARPWRSATLHTAGSAPVRLNTVTVDGKVEYHLPDFSNFAALEFQS